MIIDGVYGCDSTPCEIIIYKDFDGCWYTIKNSINVNFTQDFMENGIDVEKINDLDTFIASIPIENLEDLIDEVDK